MKTETLSTTPEGIREYLATCSGGDELYPHWLKCIRYTQGVQGLAELAGAYWLIDAIASHQAAPALRQNQRMREFQLWTLTVNADKSAMLTCREDTNDPPAVMQRIEYTDFPLPEGIKLYVESGILLLPSEH